MLAKPRIAIVEDHEDTRELMRFALESEFTCQVFSDAAQLLSALEEDKFSAIVADIMLPGLDGYGFIKAVRSNPKLSDLCVIAVTALAFKTDRDKALASGFSEFLVKPISPQDIAQALWRCIKAP